MFQKQFWLVHILIILHFQATSQEYESRFITTQEGFPNKAVTHINQDSQGLIWIAHYDGISTYNGYKFTFIKPSNALEEVVSKILFHGDMGMIALTRSGQLVHMQGDSILPFSEMEYLKNKIVDFFIDRKNRIWIMREETSDIIVLNENKEISAKFSCSPDQFEMSNMLGYKKLFASGGKNVYAVINKHTVLVINEDLQAIDTIELDPGLSAHGIISIDHHPQNYLFALAPRLIVSNRQDTRNFNIESTYSRFGRVDLGIDKDGIIWSTQGNSDILLYHPQKGIFLDSIPMNTGSYPSGIQFKNIFVDGKGTAWIGSEVGISIITKKRPLFTSYDPDGTKGQAVGGMGMRAIVKSENGDVFFSTDSHPFNKLDPETGEITKLLDQTIPAYMPSLFHGLILYDHHLRTVNGIKLNLITNELVLPNKHLKFPGNGNQENCLLLDQKGQLWTGGDEGLRVYANPSLDIAHTHIPNFTKVYNMVEGPDGDIWVCSHRAGLIRYRQDVGVIATYSPHSVDTYFISSTTIHDLFVDEKSNAWVATTLGLNRIELNHGKTVVYDEQDGISSRIIFSILPEGDSALWLGTENGLCRFDTRNYSTQNYFETDGLSHNEFNRHARLIDDDGNYFMGGIDGITHFRPEIISKRQKDSVDISLFLTEMKISNLKKSRKIDVSSIDDRRPLTLSYQDRIVDMSFALGDYQTPAENQFSYKLEGLEESWSDPDKNHQIRYTNLKAGRYLFHLKGRHKQGPWSKNVLSIPIIMQEPFYETFWFIGLCLFAVLSILYIIFQYRLEQRLKMERMRTKISSDLHDEVGGLLSGVAMQMELLQAKATPTTQSLMQSIGEASREAVQKMRDVIWVIDARSDSWHALIDRMNGYMIDQFEHTEMIFKFKHIGIPLNKKLSPTFRQNIFLIFKESITNILKHANASEVSVSIELKSGTVHMTIQDNGKGFDPQKTFSGQGLKNLKMRAENINGKLEIRSDVGTEVQLVAPVPHK